MTTSDAFTGEYVCRGGFLERSQRYERAGEVVSVTRALWESRGEPDRTACPGPTLRDHFGLRHPHASSTRQESA